MGIIRILTKKELDTSFNSWGIFIGYIVFFCICGFSNWLSNNNVLYQGQATMNSVFSILNWTQFFFIPALTMRSIANEKRNGTIELLLTKPIKTMELVMGKFLSNLVITVIALMLTLPYYITLSMLGNVDHGAVMLGYFGLICMSACYVSIGIFASSLSHTPITAFFISLGIGLFFQLFFGMLGEQVSNINLAAVLNYFSMNEHFDALSRGIFDSRDIVYFASICITFLMLSKFFVCKSRF